jgi:hypothetical protein
MLSNCVVAPPDQTRFQRERVESNTFCARELGVIPRHTHSSGCLNALPQAKSHRKCGCGRFGLLETVAVVEGRISECTAEIV